MRQLILIVMLVIGSVASFTGCWVALVDWVRNFNAGVYSNNHLEAILETSALFLYACLAIRFMKSKLNE